MKGIARWSTVLVLLIGMGAGIPGIPAAQETPAAPGDDLVLNGNFETPVVPYNLLAFNAGQTFGNWTVGSGQIDLVRSIWTAAVGAQSVDLSGSIAGSIYQDLPTVAGRTYTLTFQMAGNYAGPPTVKSMQVFWNDVSLGILTFDTTGRGPANMGWTLRTVPSLVAPGASTRLKFVSLDNTWYGPVIDDVHVVEGEGLLSSLRLSKTLLAGCLKTTGKVTLAEPAPSGGTVVSLTSSNPKVTVPASITLKAGLVTKSFPILTEVVASRESATISASAGGTPLTATLTLRPIGTKSVTLTPLSVVGGADVAGLVTLECPANPADITVTLWSTRPGVAAPDVAEVVVPQGAQTGPVTVTTFPVTAVTKASIKARANDVTKAKVLAVTPAP